MSSPPENPEAEKARNGPRRSVFRNLFLSMISFGLFMGVAFPPFARLALDTGRALSPEFFGMCMGAGLIVGLSNFLLFRFVVSREMGAVTHGMNEVVDSVEAAEIAGHVSGERWQLAVRSRDAIGDIAHSFNTMTDAIQRRLRLEETRRSLTSRLTDSVELDDVAKSLLAVVSETCGAQAGLLYGDMGEHYELLGSRGIDAHEDVPTQVDRTSGPFALAVDTGNVVMLETGKNGLEWIRQSTPLGRYRPRAVAMVPLVSKQHAIGVLVLAGCDQADDPAHHELLQAMRVSAAAHLHNAILHRKISKLAAIDDLTGLLNRRFGVRRLGEEFSRSVRHGIPVSVAIFDIDHFKQFNDTYGHDAGDVVLRAVANGIERSLRAGDVACRYGGEEIMMVAPGTGVNDCAAVADRIRRMIGTASVPWRGQNLQVSVSIGVATWPMLRISTADELITAADSALYKAKEWGRDQVVAKTDNDFEAAGELITTKDAQPA